MNLNEKIMKLRKEKGWSQEELAYKLDISRQAVSKWESGTSQPEIEKVVHMAQIFGITTDELLMTSKDSIETTKEEIKVLNKDEIELYMIQTKKVSKFYSIATAFMIISPALLIFLIGLSENNVVKEKIAVAFGLTALFLFITIGIIFYIYFGIRDENFQYIETSNLFIKEEIKKEILKEENLYQNKYSLGITIGVSICIIAVLPLIISAVIGVSDHILVCLVSLLLLLISIGVAIMVRVQMVKEMYDKLLEKGEFTRFKKQSKNTMKPFASIFWPLIVIIYLFISFRTYRWDLTWIIWVLAGILYAFIENILSIKKHK